MPSDDESVVVEESATFPPKLSHQKPSSSIDPIIKSQFWNALATKTILQPIDENVEMTSLEDIQRRVRRKTSYRNYKRRYLSRQHFKRRASQQQQHESSSSSSLVSSEEISLWSQVIYWAKILRTMFVVASFLLMMDWAFSHASWTTKAVEEEVHNANEMMRQLRYTSLNNVEVSDARVVVSIPQQETEAFAP